MLAHTIKRIELCKYVCIILYPAESPMASQQNSILPKTNLRSFQNDYLKSKQHLNVLEMIAFTVTAPEHGMLSFSGGTEKFPRC